MSTRGSMLKYFRDKGGPESGHRGQLMWPGTADGFPVLGNGQTPPDLRQEEYDNLPLSLDFKSDKFEMWDADQKNRYDEIMDRIVNGWYMQRERRVLDTERGPLIWLEWVQIYGEIPNAKNPGAGEDAIVLPANKQPLRESVRERRRDPPPQASPLPATSVIDDFPLGWPQ